MAQTVETLLDTGDYLLAQTTDLADLNNRLHCQSELLLPMPLAFPNVTLGAAVLRGIRLEAIHDVLASQLHHCWIE